MSPMSTTISTTITQTVTLGTVGTYPTYGSPLTITSAGEVTLSGTGDAIFGPGTAAWTVVNQGLVSVGGTTGDGVDLKLGGSVSNSGTIDGASYGVFIGGTVGTTGTVTNSALSLIGASAATGVGVRLVRGGYVSNAGTIKGYNGVVGATTVTNSGTIDGAAVFFAHGVYVGGGATVINSGMIAGFVGVEIKGGGTLTNSGTIQGTGAGNSSQGVYLFGGGSVGNNAGLIEGNYGVYIKGAAGTVTNSATILGTAGAGVRLNNGGNVGNNAGLIEARYSGVYIKGAAGTVTNAATIVGTVSFGVILGSGGSVGNNAGLIEGYRGVEITGAAGTVTNAATILGTHGFGIELFAGGTVIDSGTISGAYGGGAVSFGGTGGNLLVLEQGYKLSGAVEGGVSATNTLELSGSLGAVTVNYNGLSLTNFQDVLFGAGGNETLKVSNTGGTLPVTISGFGTTSDIIDLTAIGNDGSIASQSGTQVTITGSLGSETLQLDGSDGTNFTTVSDGASGTDLIACYRRGTRILTAAGEVAVEDLAIGDEVITFSGAARPIRWIGHRAYDGRFIAGNRAVLPICIYAGALAEGVPARDLFVSPEHSLYIEGVLAQAKHLLNGATIEHAGNVERVEYFHIELESHDIVFADGAPAETFVDCDNRFMFHNGAEYALLYPDDGRPSWEFCAPRLEWGSAELTEIRAALLERAAALGHTVDSDPDLHLVVDGETIPADTTGGGIYRFHVPAGSAAVWLASRSTVPAEMVAASRDVRRLGVAVERFALNDADLSIEAWHGHAALSNGFHEDEATHRWTDGLARLPESWLRPFAGAFTLELRLAPSALAYRLDPLASARAAA